MALIRLLCVHFILCNYDQCKRWRFILERDTKDVGPLQRKHLKFKGREGYPFDKDTRSLSTIVQPTIGHLHFTHGSIFLALFLTLMTLQFPCQGYPLSRFPHNPSPTQTLPPNWISYTIAMAYSISVTMVTETYRHPLQTASQTHKITRP